MLGSAAVSPLSAAAPDPPPASPSPRGSSNGTALEHPLPGGMRDLLPLEAWRQAALARRLMGAFELYGYQRVSVPAFEYAEVLERGLGALDPDDVLRFVEPETGRVVALRPDMTPQIARLLATRLKDEPAPARLCYEGSVLRRRRERARMHRQIPQAGIELLGLDAPRGDLEVLEVAAAATRATGLADFVLDLGHAGIVTALLANLPPEHRPELVEALSLKDGAQVARRAARSGLAPAEAAALAELPALHGGADIWPRAERVLAGTRAAAAAAELRRLHQAAEDLGLSPRVVVDLGETWNFAYYTGAMFQILAEGPGRPIGSGGRYDGLLARFGASRPAAGFGLDLDNLAWALAHAGVDAGVPVRVLLAAADSAALLAALRERGLPCAPAPDAGGARDYAAAWGFSHLIEPAAGGLAMVRMRDGVREDLPAVAPADLAAVVTTRIERQ